MVAGVCFILSLLVGSALGQYAWTENLYDVLTVAGVREDTPIGEKLGTINIRVPTDLIHVVYSSNSTYILVNEDTGDVRLGAQLIYRDMPSFVVEFFATDPSKGFQNSTVVTVNVKPINHAPAFDLTTYRVSIKETVKQQSIIYNTLYVTDQDTGDNGTVGLTCDGDVTACQTFRVTQQMVRQGSYLGSVFTLLSLDYLSHSSYNMLIKAQDMGNPPLTATATLIISIESAADNRPVFINTPIILLVNESAPSTTNLGVIQARSGNTDNPRQISFSISGDTKNWFYLDSPTLDNSTRIYSSQIRTTGQINRAQLISNQYTFQIIASELFNGQPTVTSETTVQVIIQDINNYAPAFQQQNYYADVTEGLGIGALLPGLSMIVTDADSGDNAYFAVRVTNINPSPVPDIFLVQPTFGQGTAAVSLIANKPEYIRYADPMKRTYTIQITAVETRTKELRSGTTTVTVNVQSVVTSPPIFTQLVYLTSLVDNRGTGTIVTDQIRAIGSGSNPGQITYSIINNGTFSSYFSIDPTSALVTLAQVVKYSQTGQYVVLTIKASSADGVSSMTALRIEIIDSTHRGPQFNLTKIEATVLEGGTDLIPPIQFSASPLERDRVVSYMIIGGNKNNTFSLIVEQKPTDPQPVGRIKMNNGVDFNDTPDRTGIFQLIVQASDNGVPTPLLTNLSVIVTVKDMNNHAPTFSPTMYSTTINEVTPGGTSLLTVSSTDADSPNNDNSKIHYIITDGSRDNFVVDYTTGLISVASQANLTIDRFGSQYNITVLAIDGGSPPMTGTAMVYITVTDSVYRQPSFSQPSYVYYVSETVSIGTNIGNVTATSPDRRATLVYSILPDSFTAKNSNGQPVMNSTVGNLDYRNSFAIDPKTGRITVNNPLSQNYTAEIHFMVQVNVTNPERSIDPATANITVYIIKQPQNSDIVTYLTPTEGSTLITSIYNNLPVGTNITRVLAYHVATQKPVTNYTYYLPGSDTQNYTIINPQTGDISLAKSLMQAQMPLNLTYQVIATADPPSRASSTSNVLIIVRALDADIPKFTQLMYNFTIMNNAVNSSTVGTIRATLPGSTITYTLTGYRVEAFYIDSKTGVIYVNNPRLVNQVNFFALSATAFAGDPPKSSQPILVYVNVLHLYNINPPYFVGEPYIYYTLDRTPVNSTVGQVHAADSDPYHSSNITYQIVSGNDQGFFKVDPNTGSISTLKNLIPRTEPYELNISATVSGEPPMTTYTTVKIKVDSVGTGSQIGFHVPESDGQTFYVYEKQPYASVVTVLGYSTRSKNLTYGFKDPVNRKYLIDPVTGILTSNGSLNLDPSQPPDIVCVTVRDDVAPQTASRCITVYTVSSQPPSLECPGLNATLTGSVPEMSPIGTNVMTVKGCTLDRPTANMSYFITGGNDPVNCTVDKGKIPFTIDKATGLIKTNANLTWNCQQTYTLNITVTNGSDPSQAGPDATKQLVITIEPTDSNGPSFGTDKEGTCRGIGEQVSEGILDFTPAGTAVIQMYAGDCDAPQFRNHTYLLDPNSITYYVSNRPTTQVQNAFKIDPVTGFVFTNLEDYRMYSEGYFQMKISAVDSKGRSATSTLKVYIVREGQRVRYVFDKTPKDVKLTANNFVTGLEDYLKKVGRNDEINGVELRTHVDADAIYYFNRTDMCFEVIKDNKVLSVPEAVKEFEPPNQDANLMLQELYKNYSMPTGPERCYIKATTHWWSGYWFLWWLLIALALFIFVLGVILNILACCFWPIYTRGYLKSRPYIVLDEPPPTSPVSDFEWQETVHRIN